MVADRVLTRRTFMTGTAAAGLAAMLSRAAAALSAEPDEPRWKIGIYTRPWDQYDYRVALDAMVESGYRYAGLMTTNLPDRRLVIQADLPQEEAARVGQEVRSRGLTVISVYGGDIPVQQSLAAGVEGMQRLIDNCVAAGAQSLLMGGVGQQELQDRYYQAIAQCCDYAAERRLTITVKPHGGLNATGPQCRRCIESVGHPNFSLWYDPGNIYYYSQGAIDPVTDAGDVAGLVREGMSIKDFRFVTQGGQQVPDVMVTPGQGMVDFPAVLQRLAAGGFQRGALVVETLAAGSGTLPEILQQARQAREFVENLVRPL